MPGGPTGRGCDTCRKQKKKCDATTSTACTRCRRRGISCIGFGQQRYKFEDEGKKFVLRSNKEKSTSSSSDLTNSDNPKQQREQRQQAVTLRSKPKGVPQIPYNSLDRLTEALVNTIDPSLDISVQLTGNLCGFLHLVPSRLGTNKALDAATDALVTAYTNYRSGHRKADSIVLSKHSRALNALSSCLNDPVTAYSSETLCAIMLLLTCQLWTTTQTTQPWLSHSVGAARILKNRGHSGPKNDFERTLLMTLRGPVVVEALSDPRIRFTPDEWDSLVLLELDDRASIMRCLARLPPLMQRGREILSQPSIHLPTLLSIQQDFYSLYYTFQPDLSTLHARWRNIDKTIDSEDLTPIQRRTLHCNQARVLGLALMVAITINCSLTALDPAELALKYEAEQMAEEILELAHVVQIYRPLGALSILLPLGAAWVGADPGTNAEGDRNGVADNESGAEGLVDTESVAGSTRARIEAALLDYTKDVYGEEAKLTTEYLQWFQRQFSLR